MDPRQRESDPIDEFLGQGTGSETNDRLRLNVFQKTSRVLRRRRWLRRTGLATGLGACYAAGILTMWLASSPFSPGRAGSVSDRRSAEGEQPAGNHLDDPLPPPQQPESALAMEWHALDSTEPRPDLFRQAGDQYMAADDLESAMRCYRGALDSASPEELEISANDNWLLIELKKAKQKEKRYAKVTHQ